MIKVFIVLAFGLGIQNCSSQNVHGVASVIRKLEQTVVQAILDADSTTLKKVWAPEFLVNTPRNDIAKGRDAVLQNQKIGLINYSSFERIIEDIQIQGTVVITMGYETFTSRSDIPGAKAGQNVKRRFTNVWMRKKGNWLQVARHASIICSQ
jgi:ketosteroid isomerase-like protein